ncbi:acyl-homoserine-lactone synthase [Novosphingobium cyanobacteriorum]|uniref:Acyl-homoserine-lactone synthase n=1 Tax=Novosphingobium cyanobacteriorum TaxID=3024215 RepID=A0ABT6CID8_9SPHN|nr:acyl-homoserine-lactone synthase [Novosphingobium cyanobacteriorum]MDF8333689.1 acyl-homoserine-lactone synthase [Novosphingobium cyanobacteriorum]
MLSIIAPGHEPDVALTRAMFAARKAVFVDILGWDVPVLDGQYEIDQFDTPKARYLILSNKGEHLASARLLLTTEPGILSGLFPMLCAGPCPQGPDVFEVTRFCLDRRLHARERRDVRDALVTGLVSYALNAGISAYCAVAEAAWYDQIVRFGWSCQPLGQPVRIGTQDLVAMLIDIDPRTPHLLKLGGITSPCPEDLGPEDLGPDFLGPEWFAACQEM